MKYIPVDGRVVDDGPFSRPRLGATGGGTGHLEDRYRKGKVRLDMPPHAVQYCNIMQGFLEK